MRTLEKKPKATRQAVGSKPTKRSHANCAQKGFEHSILYLQRTIGNQAVQQLLSANSQARIAREVMNSPSQALNPDIRSLFESRMNHDLSKVRIHTDGKAAVSARSLNSRAFAIGNDVVFGEGQYAPGTKEGQRLMAHELAHVVQQENGVVSKKIQCENVCDDPNYCTPYATAAEAASAESWLRAILLPMINATFGSEVHDLWESFLSRSPGASLAPTVFETAGGAIEDSFASASATESDMEEVLDLVIARVRRFPGWRLTPYAYTMTALSNYLTPAEMNNRDINYSNPFSKPGNIAGGIGSSDAGDDYRKILFGNVGMEKVPIVE